MTARRALLGTEDAFRQPILIIRWATTTVGCVLAAPDIVDGSARIGVSVAVIVAYTLVRTVIPITGAPGVRQQVALVVEATGIGILVAATDYFRSPIAFSIIAPIAAAGFLSGLGSSFRLATALTLAIGIPSVSEGLSLRDDVRLVAQWGVELFLVAVVAAYSKRILGDYDRREQLALDQLGRLADANELLVKLHQVSQQLPSSLDPDQALDAAIERLRELLTFDAATIILREQSDDSWTVARAYGARPLPSFPSARELPRPVRDAIRATGPIEVPNILSAHQTGVAPSAVSGLYQVLRARGVLVGVVAVERNEFSPFDGRDADLLAGFAEPVALAIDNARWFGRLKSVGAHEERSRLARDLHDRIGQSLAYLGFELDRISAKASHDQPVEDDLVSIRDDVRGVVGEVRDTLYDLRTDVSDERSASDVLTEFVGRVRLRSSLQISLDIWEQARLPRQQERELWRIAQEAIVNAERHSRATDLDITWRTDGTAAHLVVTDDGIGLPEGTPGRLDSYGLMGMRERADAIRASLSITSAPRQGVTVQATIGASLR